MSEDMSPAFLYLHYLPARARDSEQQKTVFYENEQLFEKKGKQLLPLSKLSKS